VELAQPQLVPRAEHLVHPVALGMHLEAVAGPRRDERPPARMVLDPQAELVGADERAVVRLVVEREPEVVDARHLPLARLHDDVDGAALQLRQAQLEAGTIELVPRAARLERGPLLADPPVARDELEPELGDVARLDLPHHARDEVVVEEVHARRVLPRFVSS
jgi:hypothetical protein